MFAHDKSGYGFLNRFVLSLCLIVVCAGLGSPAKASDPCLKIASRELDGFRIAEYANILKSLYEEAGVCIEIWPRPERRTHAEFMNGQIDGIVARSTDYVEKFKDQLIVVEPALATTSVHLMYDPERNGTFDKTKGFKGQRVGIPEGNPLAQRVVTALGGMPVEFDRDLNVTVLLEERNLYGLLFESFTAYHYWHINQDKPDYDLLELTKISFHHVLAKKHEEAKHKLDQALLTMIEDGRWQAKFKTLFAKNP